MRLHAPHAASTAVLRRRDADHGKDGPQPPHGPKHLTHTQVHGRTRWWVPLVPSAWLPCVRGRPCGERVYCSFYACAWRWRRAGASTLPLVCLAASLYRADLPVDDLQRYLLDLRATLASAGVAVPSKEDEFDGDSASQVSHAPDDKSTPPVDIGLDSDAESLLGMSAPRPHTLPQRATPAQPRHLRMSLRFCGCSGADWRLVQVLQRPAQDCNREPWRRAGCTRQRRVAVVSCKRRALCVVQS
jgi:hypothetical protein